MALPLSREVHQLAREHGLVVYLRYAGSWLRYCVWYRLLGVVLGEAYVRRRMTTDLRRL